MDILLHSAGAIGARRVDVQLDFGQASVRLRVLDDGAGTPEPVGQGGGFGLLGLRERAEQLGGVFRPARAKTAAFCSSWRCRSPLPAPRSHRGVWRGMCPSRNPSAAPQLSTRNYRSFYQ